MSGWTIAGWALMFAIYIVAVAVMWRWYESDD